MANNLHKYFSVRDHAIYFFTISFHYEFPEYLLRMK